jgi:hypothetical protein
MTVETRPDKKKKKEGFKQVRLILTAFFRQANRVDCIFTTKVFKVARHEAS